MHIPDSGLRKTPLSSLPMEWMRHIAVGLLTVALTVGTGWQSCTTLQQQTPSFASAMDATTSHHAMGHTGHDRMAVSAHDEAQSADTTNVQPDVTDHACMKCCGACLLGGVAAAAPELIVSRTESRITFVAPDEQLRGHPVFVDPDIPISVV